MSAAPSQGIQFRPPTSAPSPTTAPKELPAPALNPPPPAAPAKAPVQMMKNNALPNPFNVAQGDQLNLGALLAQGGGGVGNMAQMPMPQMDGGNLLAMLFGGLGGGGFFG